MAFHGDTGPDSKEQSYWCACVVNCGQRCPLRVIVKDGRVARIETDNQSAENESEKTQLRACQRGRSLLERLYSPDRLKYPMKRAGKRGEGKFVRISWEEAVQTIAREWKRIKSRYGNEAIYWQYGTAQKSMVNGRVAWHRLMNLMGGYLRYYGSYSDAQIASVIPLTYGGEYASLPAEIKHAKLYVLFGNNTLVTNPSGGGRGFQIAEALRESGAKVIVIDPRLTDTAALLADQWIPITPGTDAALASALAYEWIVNGAVDQEFLDKYCIGFEQKSLPVSGPPNSDYKSYILGKGGDGIAKTPRWASSITGIPEETIVELAREMAEAKPLFVSQGLGPQRRANGEETCRAIFMLPILLGQIGLKGTNTGLPEGNVPMPKQYFPVGENVVKAKIPMYLWTDAVLNGKAMTRKNAGVRGAEKLKTGIKMIINSGGNTLINQHGNINRTDKILRDESKAEFILVCDNMMTPSCRYADIILPDTLGPETNDLVPGGEDHGNLISFLAVQKAAEPEFEQKPTWEICRLIAKELGLEKEYTQGKSQGEWIRFCYEETRRKIPGLPEFGEFWSRGMAQIRNRGEPAPALEAFRKDPENHPLPTPSGKIEIYSQSLAEKVKDWELPEGEKISPIPVFRPTFDMPGDPASEKYPLQCFGFHGHGRIHSTFHNLPRLRDLHPDRLWINPVDAECRGIQDGDSVFVFNSRGKILIRAKVTRRIMPGVCALPQGAWHLPRKINGQTVDAGGCVNTLTDHRPSLFAKGNSQHNILVEVEKAEGL